MNIFYINELKTEHKNDGDWESSLHSMSLQGLVILCQKLQCNRPAAIFKLASLNFKSASNSALPFCCFIRITACDLDIHFHKLIQY